MKKIFASISLALLLSACAQQTFVMNPHGASTPTLDEQQPFFVSGLGQKKTLSAAEVCGSADKVAKVESQLTFPNVLLGIVSFGIYTPRDARVYCTQ